MDIRHYIVSNIKVAIAVNASAYEDPESKALLDELEAWFESKKLIVQVKQRCHRT